MQQESVNSSPIADRSAQQPITSLRFDKCVVVPAIDLTLQRCDAVFQHRGTLLSCSNRRSLGEVFPQRERQRHHQHGGNENQHDSPTREPRPERSVVDHLKVVTRSVVVCGRHRYPVNLGTAPALG